MLSQNLLIIWTIQSTRDEVKIQDSTTVERCSNHDAATSERAFRQQNSRLAAVSPVATVSVGTVQSPSLLVRGHNLQKLTENLSD